MPKQKNYWLLKSEPRSYSINDFARDKKTLWTGIRNYQARNFMRDDMNIGDEFLFYHSSTEQIGVVGAGKVIAKAASDETALDKKNHSYDPKAKKDNNPWVAPELQFVAKFPRVILLEELKKDPKLQGLMVIQRGSRLSVQPVSKDHFLHIAQLSSS